jgi:hypothetical protein
MAPINNLFVSLKSMENVFENSSRKSHQTFIIDEEIFVFYFIAIIGFKTDEKEKNFFIVFSAQST